MRRFEASHCRSFLTDFIRNRAIALSARLKALGVDSVMAEKNPCPGDNWALRYDCMKFHIPTSFCELPFMCTLINITKIIPRVYMLIVICGISI